MDFLTLALVALSIAFAGALLVACLTQVLWLGRAVVVRLHRVGVARH